ncbi:alpha/beta hydrolase [Nonomuraea sp. NPDC050451]|uniref:alpha/beta hydrolase n=1 Tax=Nonomuraea sp. NPDC050451 TaxID=3364364 RepID=UPI0037882935
MLRNLLLAGLVTVGALVVWPGQPSGRLVRVYGDLTTADRVAVIVPGADTTVATFDDGTKRPGGAARTLLAEAARLAPGERLAVVAWLGYDSPPTLSLGVITSDAAVKGAQALRRTITDLQARTPAPIALLCHSYGSVLCAKAVPGLRVADLAVFGSPGLDTPSATALTHPTHAPATTTATVSAPTPDTPQDMTGGQDAQGATGPQDTRGTTDVQDDHDPAGWGDVQKAGNSVSAQDATGAQGSRRATSVQGTADPPNAQRTAGLQDTWLTADLHGAGGTAALPGTQAPPPDARGTASLRDARSMPGPQDVGGTAGSPDTRATPGPQDDTRSTAGSPDTPTMPGPQNDGPGTAGSPDTQVTPGPHDDTLSTAGSPDAQVTPGPQNDGPGTAGSPKTHVTPGPQDDTRSTADVQGAEGGATGAAVAPLRVWAGLGKNDWVRFVPKVKLGPVGFGADPMSPSFGARVFAVGSGGHSDYFTPGTPSLRNLALIALGRAGEVTS